ANRRVAWSPRGIGSIPAPTKPPTTGRAWRHRVRGRAAISRPDAEGVWRVVEKRQYGASDRLRLFHLGDGSPVAEDQPSCSRNGPRGTCGAADVHQPIAITPDHERRRLDRTHARPHAAGTSREIRRYEPA